MSEPEPEEEQEATGVDLETVDDDIAARHKWLVEQNTEMIQVSRRRARKMFAVADRFDEMAVVARDIANMNVMAASQLAEIVGDQLVAEFDIEVTDGEEGEADDDEITCK